MVAGAHARRRPRHRPHAGGGRATVYCTGRSVDGNPATAGRPETIDETAAMIAAEGGRSIAVRTDHTVEPEVERLFGRIRAEQGR